jgi:hypothetical protein
VLEELQIIRIERIAHFSEALVLILELVVAALFPITVRLIIITTITVLLIRLVAFLIIILLWAFLLILLAIRFWLSTIST